MAQSNYLEPIEKEDLDMKNKFQSGANRPLAGADKVIPEDPETQSAMIIEKESGKEEKISQPAVSEAKETEPTGPEKETGAEVQEEKVGEKIETARKTIQTHKPASAAAVSDDAKTVAGITEYGKKVEKLIELALQKGPEHAIKVARHMDTNDNYTLDELHDRMIEDNLRKQLIQKGLLREL